MEGSRRYHHGSREREPHPRHYEIVAAPEDDAARQSAVLGLTALEGIAAEE